MMSVAMLILLGTAWALWNLYGKVQRLDALIEQWEDTLATLQQVEQGAAAGKAGSGLRVIIEITDAVELAKRYHWAGSAGALAPNVLKKTIQGRVLKETQKAMLEGGHDAEVKVIVL